MRRKIISFISATILGLSGAVIAPIATTSAPASAQTLMDVCLTSSSGYCWTTHGVGNQLTIENSGYTDFYLESASHSAFKIHPSGSSGHCVTAHSNPNDVTIENCSAGNTQQEWYGTIWNSGCTLETYFNIDKNAVVYNNANGKPVWEDPNNSPGAWKTWNAHAFAAC